MFASDVLHEMVGNVRKVNTGLIFPWRQHRVGSGQEGTGCALTSIPAAQCSCHRHRNCLSFQPIHSCSLEGGWGRVIPDVPPVTHILCHLRKLEEKLARVPRLGLSFLPGAHSGQHGTSRGLRGLGSERAPSHLEAESCGDRQASVNK